MERQNIEVNVDSEVDGETFFMCNLRSAPKTVLSKVKNCTFNMCNLYDCTVDDSNTLTKCVVHDSTIVPELVGDEKRIAQLEKFITDNSLSVPKEVI